MSFKIFSAAGPFTKGDILLLPFEILDDNAHIAGVAMNAKMKYRPDVQLPDTSGQIGALTAQVGSLTGQLQERTAQLEDAKRTATAAAAQYEQTIGELRNKLAEALAAGVSVPVGALVMLSQDASGTLTMQLPTGAGVAQLEATIV